jgi:lipid A disaccharide synthetase
MKKIMKLQNIKLMHPLVNSDEIIKKSDLVVTIRGTSAIDAAFHNKPSIIFGNVGLFQLSFIHKLKSIEELPQAIKNSLKKRVDPKEFKKYLDAIDSESFESEFQSLIAAYEQIFHKGGYYVNVEIESDKLDSFLKKYKNEFTKLALYHIAKMKELN